MINKEAGFVQGSWREAEPSCREDSHLDTNGGAERPCTLGFELPLMAFFGLGLHYGKLGLFNEAKTVWIFDYNNPSLEPVRVSKCGWRAISGGGEGRLPPKIHACSQKIPGVVHLAAPGTGLGLESELVCGDALRAPDAHDAASLDALQTAQKLCGQISASPRSLFQTALLWSEVAACLVKKGQICQVTAWTVASWRNWMCLCRLM